MDNVKLTAFRRFISINSVTGNEEMFKSHLSDILKSQGFKVEDRGCLYAEYGKGAKIGILGHLDTFPPVMGWKGDPFRLRVVGRKGYGLGAFDMKGGIFSFILSEPDIPIKAAFAVNEIGKRHGSWEIMNSGFFSDVDLVISLHGTEFGPRSLIIGRVGEIVIKVTVINREDNPIPDALSIVSAVSDEDISFHPHLGFSSIEPIKVESIGKVGKPDKVILEFRRTLLPGETAESSISALRSKISRLGLSSAIKVSLKKTVASTPPYEMAGAPYVDILERIIRENYKVLVKSYLKTPGVENLIAQVKPVVSIGPRGGNRGVANEWVDLKSIERVASILSAFFSSLE